LPFGFIEDASDEIEQHESRNRNSGLSYDWQVFDADTSKLW